MITHDTLLRVRETARIDEVAAGYLTLRRSGKDLVALCPFHDERHPSFRISPALNIGKCFSCGEAADPIRLVRHMEGCGFEEAVRLLARKYGIEVEEERGTEEAGRHEARQAILRGNEDFARSLLPYDPAEGITGKDENGEEDRRALREAFSHFGVGICPPDAPEGFRRFRRRLVFPVRTTGGQIAGFAGRYRGTEGAGRKGGPDAGGIREVLGEIRLVGSPLAVYQRVEELSKATGIPLDVLREELSASPGEPVRTGPAEVVTGLPPARLRERALLRFCLANHDRMFYAGDGSGISLPAWVASELSAGGMPLTEPAHLDLLALLSGSGHPDGITDESLSALILSLRSSYPEEGPPERLPDELLPDEAERQLFLYAEPFIHDRLQRTAAHLRSATSTDERATCLKELRDCFALSDRIGRALGSQSVRRVEG